MKSLPLAILTLTLCACGQSFDERLKREAQTFTRTHCPQRLDAMTTLDSAVYDIPSRTYIRYYSVSASAIPVLQQNSLAVRAGLLNELKGDASWKSCKDEGVSFRYIYRVSGSSTPVYTTTLTATDYQSPES